MDADFKGGDVREYLIRQGREVMTQIYEHPPGCLAVFRLLPALAKYIVMRLIFTIDEFDVLLVESWTNVTCSNFMKIKGILSDLHIWSFKVNSVDRRVSIHHAFKANLQVALSGGGCDWLPSLENQAQPIDKLDRHARQRWETVLFHILGSRCAPHDRGSDNRPSDSRAREIHNLVVGAKLMKGTTFNSSTITKSGFQFLLQARKDQIWFYIFRLLDAFEPTTRAEGLSLLFQLGFSECGEAYSSKHLSNFQKSFLSDLNKIGLVLISGKGGRIEGSISRFFPTQAAISLVEPDSDERVHQSENGYLMIETTFRVYAEDASELQVALLNQFVKVEYRLAGLTICSITRDRILAAMATGISASQIVYFLKAHAHRDMFRSSTQQHPHWPLPENVSSQIFRWESERDMVLFEMGTMITGFADVQEFNAVRAFVESGGWLVWSGSATVPSRSMDSVVDQTLILAPEGLKDVREFWKRERTKE